MVAHAGAGWIDAATGYTLKDSEVGFYGGLLGGAASALVGNKDRVAQNFGSGQTTGQNAVDNNYLSTRDITAAKAQLAQCTQGCEAIARVLGVDQSQGGAQTPVSRVQDLCKANPQGCAARVQDMALAMQELQDPATRAALGPQVADRLLQRQAADLGQAVESLQWGVEHEASSRRIAQTAMAVGATALGGGIMLSVGRALVAACASGIGSPSCVAASTELAVGAMEAAGGVPTTGVTAAAASTGVAGRLAAAAAEGKDAHAVLREVRVVQAELRGGANGAVTTVISPEMEAKILFGERVKNASGMPTNRLIGAHAGEISNSSPSYAVEVLSVNADGTRNAKLVTQFSDGNLSNIKSSTLFPENWTTNQTMSAVKQVGDLPPVATRADGATLYQSTVNGVKIEVIKVGNNVTAAYPCGRGCTSPTTFAGQ